MKKVSLLIVLSLVFCLNLSNFSKKTDASNNIRVENIDNTNRPATEASTKTVTMKDIELFLKDKKEHYPFSDEFVEKYQQKSGGYIENAKKAGLVVDKTLHEPNQKWHFYESWLYPSIEDGSLSYDESAKSRVYSKLLCPELLLWIYEACGVSPEKVRDAKNIAEEGKVKGLAVTTIAKNMRGIVAWEDLESNILNYELPDDGGNDTPDTPETPVYYKVGVNNGEGFEVVGLNNEYSVGSEVTFSVNVTDSTKVINNVKVNDNRLTPTNGNNYKFTMPNKDVVIYVTLKDKVSDVPTDNASIATYGFISTNTKAYSSEESVLDSFVLNSGTNIINEVSAFDYIYGAGSGGSGDNRWSLSNTLKISSTSQTGSITLDLNAEVNQVKITGYIHKSNCKVQIGDSSSLTTVDPVDLDVISKEVLDANEPRTIVVDFDATSSLTIKTTSAVALYITSIELINTNYGK